jgi:hypothetical protein
MFRPSINIIFRYIHVSRLIILREFTPLLLQAAWIYGTFDAFMCFYLSSARRTFGVNSWKDSHCVVRRVSCVRWARLVWMRSGVWKEIPVHICSRLHIYIYIWREDASFYQAPHLLCAQFNGCPFAQCVPWGCPKPGRTHIWFSLVIVSSRERAVKPPTE